MASGQEVEVSLVRLKSVMVGLARIDNLQVAVYEIGVLDSTANPPLVVDGFLGADFLSRFTMTIDAQAEEAAAAARRRAREVAALFESYASAPGWPPGPGGEAGEERRRRRESPRWRRATSAKSSRKSVVTARSRPSKS